MSNSGKPDFDTPTPARRTTARVGELSKAAARIGDELINAIASEHSTTANPS